eukprot:m.35970 g.35970  ORF g.35970 m.35970 type:complete len:808 (-) comp6639_c0_seq1:1754-4177(-)
MLGSGKCLWNGWRKKEEEEGDGNDNVLKISKQTNEWLGLKRGYGTNILVVQYSGSGEDSKLDENDDEPFIYLCSIWPNLPGQPQLDTFPIYDPSQQLLLPIGWKVPPRRTFADLLGEANTLSCDCTGTLLLCTDLASFCTTLSTFNGHFNPITCEQSNVLELECKLAISGGAPSPISSIRKVLQSVFLEEEIILPLVLTESWLKFHNIQGYDIIHMMPQHVQQGSHSSQLLKHPCPFTVTQNINFNEKVPTHNLNDTVHQNLNIAGLDEPFQELLNLIMLPFSHHNLFEMLGAQPILGVLLHGPPGCGKTLLVSEVTRVCSAKLHAVQSHDIIGDYVGDTEENLRRVFQKAAEESLLGSCVLFIDEIDAICPKRDGKQSHQTRSVAQMLTLMDGVQGRGKLVVIGATNLPHSLDEALRRPGRFDREVHIPPPTVEQRQAIFAHYLSRVPISPEVDTHKLAKMALGFVGADISSCCRDAALTALKATTVRNTGDCDGGDHQVRAVMVTHQHLLDAITRTTPSIKRSSKISVDPVYWGDVGGLEDVKKQLQKAVEWPLKYHREFQKLHLQPSKGVLLYGPPGCSKTLLARVIATESASSFFSLSGAEVYSPFVGDSEKTVRELFDRARKSQPSIIFLDEIESIVGKRTATSSGSTVSSRVLSTMLNEMDGIENAGRVFIIAATNRPDMIDSAFLRTGRIDTKIFVPPPEKEGREKILSVMLKAMKLEETVDISVLAQKTTYFSGADLRSLCDEAGLEAMRRFIIANGEDSIEDLDCKGIEMCAFEHVLKNMTPSLTKEKIDYYKNLGSV